MVEKSFDCQVPCEGIYADVKKIPFENPILKNNFEIFRLQYQRYRRFFENAGGNKFALLWGEAQLCLPYVC